MDEPQVALIAEHVTLSWPQQTLDPGAAGLWIKDFKLLDYETMIMAVDGLRRTQDFLPTTHQLIEAHGHVWVELHPHLPEHKEVAEQDPRRPYNLAWRLLMETWMHLKAASFRADADQTATARSRKLFLSVNEEIQALYKAQAELMPPGEKAVAPERLVVLAVAAQERVRKLLFGAEQASGPQDGPQNRTVGHREAPETPAPPIQEVPFSDPRLEDPDDLYE